MKLKKVEVKVKIGKKKKIELDPNLEANTKLKKVVVMIKKEAKNHIKIEIIQEKSINKKNE